MKKLSESSVRDWRTEKKKSAIKKRKIDYSDIPPLSDRQLASMRRVGRLHWWSDATHCHQIDPTASLEGILAAKRKSLSIAINDLRRER
jgi:hypothetical protein